MKKMEQEKHVFAKVLTNYLHLLKSQMKTYPIIHNTLTARLKANISRIEKFFLTHNISPEESDDKSTYSIPSNLMKPFVQLTEEIDHAAQALQLTPRNLIVAFVSIYDSFISEIIRATYTINPELLNSCTKEIPVTPILKAESIEIIKQQIIEKEAEMVLRDSHSKQLKWLESKLGITLTKDFPNLKHFIEITERRNLYVHTNGKVSDQYLENCDPTFRTIKGKSLQVGDELQVSPSYVEHAYNILFEIGVKLCQVVWRHLEKNRSIEEVDDILVNIIYDLLKERDYKLAIVISEFATKSYVKSYNKVNECIKCINKALAYYLNEDSEECKKILESQDWSASDLQFKLAVAVLDERYDDAYDYMREIGQKERMKDSYREWPLFTKIRERDEFKDVYKAIYGEPFEYIEIKPVNWTDIIQESLELSKMTPYQNRESKEEPIENPNSKPMNFGDECTKK